MLVTVDHDINARANEHHGDGDEERENALAIYARDSKGSVATCTGMMLSKDILVVLDVSARLCRCL